MKNLQNYTKKHANDGAYIRKRRDREDAYQNGKYVKIKKDEVIINLLNGPIIGIKGEKKSIIMNEKTDLVCGDATSSVADTTTKAANGNVFKCTIASEIDGGHDDHAESITATSKSKEKSGIRKKRTGKQGNEEIVHEIVEISGDEANN